MKNVSTDRSRRLGRILLHPVKLRCQCVSARQECSFSPRKHFNYKSRKSQQLCSHSWVNSSQRRSPLAARTAQPAAGSNTVLNQSSDKEQVTIATTPMLQTGADGVWGKCVNELLVWWKTEGVKSYFSVFCCCLFCLLNETYWCYGP